MRLTTLKGYTGTDVDLGISLYEYGLAWKYIEQDNEYKFYYKVKSEEIPNKCLFDCSTVGADIDVWEEYNWIDKEDKTSLLSFVGLTEDEFNKLPLPNKISDIVNYFEFINVFGESYGPFTITSNQY